MSTPHLDSAGSRIQGIGAFPREVTRFFTQERGHSLLIKGAPGTGKTLLTIRALDVLASEGDVLYVSTRVNQETVYEMYVEETTSLDRSNILDLSQKPFELPMDVAVPFDSLDIDSFLEWIESVRNATNHLTTAFDSWELIYEYLAARSTEGADSEKLTTQLAALARKQDIQIILVSETAEASALEYVVDGVLALRVAEDERGRTKRTLVMEKLRGVRIGNRVTPYTLTGGGFHTITPIDLPSMQSRSLDGIWEPVENSKAKFSTGIRDLDRILTGGYNRGSVVHLELGTDLSRDAWSLLTVPTIRNFIAHEMSVVVVPPRESSPGLLQHDLNTVLPSDVFDEHCHIVDSYAAPFSEESSLSTNRSNEPEAADPTESSPGERTESTQRDETLVSMSTIDYTAYMKQVERMREESEGPISHVLSMDTMQSALGPRLGEYANYVALHNDLAVLITKPGGELQMQADRVADMHFRLERQGKSIIFYGENPLTPLLGTGIDYAQTIPEIVLTEVV